MLALQVEYILKNCGNKKKIRRQMHNHDTIDFRTVDISKINAKLKFTIMFKSGITVHCTISVENLIKWSVIIYDI